MAHIHDTISSRRFVITVYFRGPPTKSPGIVHQNSSVSRNVTWKEEEKGETGRGETARKGVKKGQEKANIKRRWAGDTAISGTGRKKSDRLRRLKKELAKRSLRLMCREEARAWERVAYLSAVHFGGVEVLLNVRCAAARMSSRMSATCHAGCIYSASLDRVCGKKMLDLRKREERQKAIAKKQFFFFTAVFSPLNIISSLQLII